MEAKYGGCSYVYGPPHSNVLRAMGSVDEWGNEIVSFSGWMVLGEYEMADSVFSVVGLNRR